MHTVRASSPPLFDEIHATFYNLRGGGMRAG